MPWSSSGRRERLPDDWPERVARVKKKAEGRCQWRMKSGKRCPRPGTDVDHKIPGDDHSYKNLQLLCEHHHGKKSAKEGHQARWGDRSVPLRSERQPGTLR